MDAARIAAAGRLDALRNGIKAAAGHLSQRTTTRPRTRAARPTRPAISGHARVAAYVLGQRLLLG